MPNRRAAVLAHCCRSWLLLAALLLPGGAFAGVGLTGLETRWLDAGSPVLDEADAQQLPLDVIVQPQATAGQTPVAMAYLGGRCKLVLSLRGNAEAQRLLADAPAGLEPLLMEAIVAHELGHCWRHTQGAWQGSGASDWREEAYADLVALAWIAGRHPARYAEVYGWMSSMRRQHAGSAHDTRRFLSRAAERSAFAPAGSAFEQAEALWREEMIRPDPGR